MKLHEITEGLGFGISGANSKKAKWPKQKPLSPEETKRRADAFNARTKQADKKKED